MKKFPYLILFLLFLLAAPCSYTRAESSRELTLMIYMCGSNLESEYGSATADMQEILQSGFDAKKTTVLVMAGGSESWHVGLDPEEISISEFGARGSRIVWHEKKQNMGEPETLTQLLRFGKEKFPARKYALILWDHGGGPMEGLCWDELFEMDHLTLPELTGAIEAAELPEKLSWIGFDACLMGSAEVACAVSLYADYMIASQETEPAKGWNYAFLSRIENDISGAETGRRIVDCFFDALSDSKDILTLSCIDLSRMEELVSLMDDYFAAVRKDLNAEDFALFSNIRKISTGFGKAVRGAGDSSYDLVDLKDLISHYDQDSSELAAALSDAVVCSRSSEEGAGGLSVYHPYSNKEKYIRSWRADYGRLKFSREYTRYMERFGTFLTGTQLADWKGLVTDYEGVDENHTHMLSLALTEEQQMDLSSVQLMILENSLNSDPLSLAPVSVETAQLHEDGTVSARYGGRSLYVTDDDGNILTGPVSFLLSEDGSYYTVLVHYYDHSSKRKSKDETMVMYHCVPDPETGDLEIARTYVYDWATGTYSIRIPFSPEGFTELSFWYFRRPVPEGKDPLPGFDEWESGSGYLEIGAVDPAEPWHLHFFDDRPGSNLYAMFQITDIQQNVYSSVPVMLEDFSRKELTVIAEDTSCDDYRAAFSAEQVISDQHPRVRITMDITNTSDKTLKVSTGRLILNGSRTANGSFYFSDLEPGAAESCGCTVSDDDLLGLTEIRSVDFTIEVKEKGNYVDEPETKSFHLVLEDCVLSGEPAAGEVLAEAKENGITWKLMSLSWDVRNRLNGLLYIRNDTDSEWTEDGFLLVNDVRSEGSYSFTLSPHTDKYVPVQMDNASHLTMFDIYITDSHRLSILGVPDALQKAGVQEIDRIELISSKHVIDLEGTFDHRICLDLKEPLPVPDFQEEEQKAVPLLEGEIGVSLESVLAGDDGIGIGLRLSNTSDETILVKPGQLVINDISYDEFDPYRSIALPAHTKAVQCFSLRDYDGVLAPGLALDSISFNFTCGNRVSEPVVIRFPEGSAFGVSGGSYFNAEDLEISPAVLKNEPMLLAETVWLPDSEDVRSIALKAPVDREKVDQVEYCAAALSLLSWETAADETGAEKEYAVTRHLSRTSLSRAPDGEYKGSFSGLVLMADAYPLDTEEYSRGDGSYELTSDSLFFYEKAEDHHPTEDWLFYELTFFLTSDFCIDVHITPDMVSLEDCRLDLKNLWDSKETRTNFSLSEAELGAVDSRLYYGTDRETAIDTLDHNEAAVFPVKDTVQLSLVPADSLAEDLCIYYVVQYKDGSRYDCIVDLQTGETICP